MGVWLDYARPTGEIVANASASSDGFMSAPDKRALDTVVAALASPYRITTHLAAMLARGATQPTLGAGNFTNGAHFYFVTPATLLGFYYWWPTAAVGQTLTWKLWKNGVAVETHANVTPAAAGLQTFLLTSAVPITSVGNGLYDRYTFSVLVTSAVENFYLPSTYFVALGPGGMAPQAGGPAIVLTPGVMVEAWFVQSAGGGDQFPNSTVGGWAMMDPIYTIP
jgi:hypothetical protein